jgi:hypothetical protein
MRELADTPAVLQFLEDRGLDPEHAASVGVKALDEVRIAYPLWNGQWKVRNVQTKDMAVIKMGIDDKPLPAVFGHMWQGLATANRTFHVHATEGETDALALSQVLSVNSLPGIAVAVPGVDGISHAVRLLRPMLGENVHITIYPDSDEAGQRLASAASELGAYVVQLPPGKDVCSYLGSLETSHRWPALQLLRHHASTYVPYNPSQRAPKRTQASYASDVPDGVRSYFQRLVGEWVGPDSIGYSNPEKVCCPWHVDPNPSLSIDWDRCVWFCHGCQKGGGVKRWQELARATTT